MRAFKPFNARSSGCQGAEARFLPGAVFVNLLLLRGENGHQHVSLVSGKRPIYKSIKAPCRQAYKRFNTRCEATFFASTPGVKIF